MMQLITSLLDKALFLAFFLSLLHVIRFSFFFFRELIKDDLIPQKFTNQQILWFGLALAMVLTSIFNGITL